MTLNELLARIDALRSEIDALRPLAPDMEARLVQKLNLEWNYHSNLILMQHGYVPVIIPLEARGDYLLALERADAGDLADFVSLVGRELIRSLELTLAAARGEPPEPPGGLDRRIARLREQLAAYTVAPADA